MKKLMRNWLERRTADLPDDEPLSDIE